MAETSDDAPRYKREPAASATYVPTLNSLHNNNIKRLSSYTGSLEESDDVESGVKPENNNDNNRSSENKVKAALTELLNDADVKNNPGGNRSVQNLLMKTEREWKKHRRESLHELAPE